MIENPVDTATRWLIAYLIKENAPVSSRAIKDSFKQDFPRVSERTLERAKTKIGIHIERRSGKSHGTFWILPIESELSKFVIDKEQPLSQAQKEYIASQRSRQSAYLLRMKIMQRYGDKCALCGNPHFDFLELDHIKGDGAQHRKEYGKTGIYRAVLAEDYRPDRYRILCKICNWLARWLTDDEIRASLKLVRFPENNIAIKRDDSHQFELWPK